MTRSKRFVIVIFGVVATPFVALLVTAITSPPLFRHVLHPNGRLVYGYNSRTEDVGGVAIDEAHKTVVYGDIEQRGEYCDSNSQYSCVNGAGFHFAVPRALNGAMPAWTVGGYTYQVRTENQIEDIDGHKIKTLVIDSNQSPTLTWTYYYSPYWGLLAFEQKEKDRTIRRVAVGCFGFAGEISGSLVSYLFEKCWNTDAAQ